MNITADALRHPEIRDVLPKWRRSRTLLEERESEYTADVNFLTLPNESTTEKDARKESFRLGFVNQAGSLLRAKGDAIYRKDIQRNNLTSMQTKFLEAADKSLQGFQEIMQAEVAPSLGAFGTVFGVIDKPDVLAVNRAEEEAVGVPYITILDPFQVIDFEWNKKGSLKWFKYAVKRWEDRSPTSGDTKVADINEYQDIITWTETDMTMQKDGGAAETVPHSFGFVPVVIQAQFVDPNHTIGKTSFFTSSRYIFAGNNLLHASNNEVFKNAAAILLMQMQDFTDEEVIKPVDADSGLRKIEGKTQEQKRVMVYQNPQAKPAYLERDLTLIEQAAVRAEAYFDLAAENERSALSVSTAKLPESGVAKSYDFTEINAVLAAAATALQRFEQQVFDMVDLMTGGNGDTAVIIYPQDFDVRDYNAKINFVAALQKINFPQMGINEAMKSVTSEVTSDQDKQNEINKLVEATKPAPKEPTQGVNNGNQ